MVDVGHAVTLDVLLAAGPDRGRDAGYSESRHARFDLGVQFLERRTDILVALLPEGGQRVRGARRHHSASSVGTARRRSRGQADTTITRRIVNTVLPAASMVAVTKSVPPPVESIEKP